MTRPPVLQDWYSVPISTWAIYVMMIAGVLIGVSMVIEWRRQNK